MTTGNTADTFESRLEKAAMDTTLYGLKHNLKPVYVHSNLGGFGRSENGDALKIEAYLDGYLQAAGLYKSMSGAMFHTLMGRICSQLPRPEERGWLSRLFGW